MEFVFGIGAVVILWFGVYVLLADLRRVRELREKREEIEAKLEEIGGLSDGSKVLEKTSQ